jgi:hypothetical protein
MRHKKPIRVFRIIDNPSDARAPFALVNPEDEIVDVSDRVRLLADRAFARFGEEIEVRHDEDLVRAEGRGA